MQHDISITLMALGTVAMNVAAVALFFGYLAGWKSRIVTLIDRWGLWIVFLISAGCLVGSLFIQYVVNLPPCDLCWWQRIFLYPTAFISGVALLKRFTLSDIADFVIVLSIPGALVALYQHLLQMLPAGALIPCDATNECAVRSIFEFGYITMPWMAFSALILLILVAYIGRGSRASL